MIESQGALTDVEASARKLLKTQADESWKADTYIFKAYVPDRRGVSRLSAQDLAIVSDRGENGSAQFFEAVGAELARQVGLKK